MVRPGNDATPDPSVRYRHIKNLNKGAFGFVVLAEDTASRNQLVAIKFIAREVIDVEYVQRELINHRLLNHPHIIKFHDVFLDEDNLAIVMEYANGGDMSDYLRRKGKLAEDVSRRFFQQLMVAIDYCHKIEVVNRDLKLENSLLHQTSTGQSLLKVCDFGYSKSMKYQSKPDTLCGTPAYLAPEVIAMGSCASGEDGKVPCYDGKAADIWACGVMLYTMLCGEYPFERNDPSPPSNPHLRNCKMYERILSVDVDYRTLKQHRVSLAAIDLLQHIFVKDPLQRITVSGIYQHRWFLKDLPASALGFNDKLIRSGQAHVPEDDQLALRQVVEQAKQGISGARGSTRNSGAPFVG